MVRRCRSRFRCRCCRVLRCAYIVSLAFLKRKKIEIFMRRVHKTAMIFHPAADTHG